MTANGDSAPVPLPFLGGVHTDLSVCAGPGTSHCTFLHRRCRSSGKKSWNRSLASSRMDRVRNTQGVGPEERTQHLPNSPWSMDLNPKAASKAAWCHIPASLQVPSAPSSACSMHKCHPNTDAEVPNRKGVTPPAAAPALCPRPRGAPQPWRPSRSTLGSPGSAFRAKEMEIKNIHH